MTLLDRFKNDSSNRVSTHGFARHVLAIVMGKQTRADMVSSLGLDDTPGNDKDQIDELIVEYQAQPDPVSKLAFIYLMEGFLIMYEAGDVDEAKVKSVLGLN